jgi:hypothetical protein
MHNSSILERQYVANPKQIKNCENMKTKNIKKETGKNHTAQKPFLRNVEGKKRNIDNQAKKYI